jgi:signal transduction histidine kinase/ActR/RegA family two-component response regulator
VVVGVPGAISDRLTRAQVLGWGESSSDGTAVVLVGDGPMHVVPSSSGTVWMEAGESEASFARTLGLVAGVVRNSHALGTARRQAEANPNAVLRFSGSGRLEYGNSLAREVLQVLSVDGQSVRTVMGEWVSAAVSGLQFIETAAGRMVFDVAIDKASGSVQVHGMATLGGQDAEQRTTEMEAESRNKDEFLATMSHELRTPLNAILSCTEAMREGAYGYMDAEQLDAVRTIRESGKHLLCLITDILDISKMAAGRLEISQSTIGLEAVCESVIEMLRSSAAAKKIELVVENDATSATLCGDPLRIKQILLNLLGNAIKFSPSGSRVGLRVNDGPSGGTLSFQVWDSGPGVSSGFSNAIFKPFVQAEGSYSRSKPGTGLGLAIARDLARLHDGELVLEAFDEPGAVFTLTLPVGQGSSAEVFDFRATGAWMLDEAQDAGEPDEAGIERVLIAEDIDSNFQHLHDLLVSMGYAVERACNGQEAVELCFDSKPDLVLMDIDMPVMNGLDAIRLLRDDAETTRLPIIAVTAMAGVADERACLAAGASGYLAKPYPLRELMAMMQSVGRSAAV